MLSKYLSKHVSGTSCCSRSSAGAPSARTLLTLSRSAAPQPLPQRERRMHMMFGCRRNATTWWGGVKMEMLSGIKMEMLSSSSCLHLFPVGSWKLPEWHVNYSLYSCEPPTKRFPRLHYKVNIIKSPRTWYKKSLNLNCSSHFRRITPTFRAMSDEKYYFVLEKKAYLIIVRNRYFLCRMRGYFSGSDWWPRRWCRGLHENNSLLCG